MKNSFLFLILIAAAIHFSACDSSKKPAYGPEDEIYVLADSVEYLELEPVLDSTFEKIIYTPQPENLFTLIRVAPQDFERYKDGKNVIIAAPLNSESQTSQFIEAILDSAVETKIRSDEDIMLKKYDIWAEDQIVLVLTAPTMEELKAKIKRNNDNLLYAVQKISDRRLYESLYSARYEQMDIEGEFLKDYNWIIYVQADYQVAINDSVENFVWLRRAPGTDMERWIFVHWIENASPVYLTEDSIRAIRNRVTKKFYRTTDDSAYVQIAQHYYTTNEVNFNGRYAIFTQGLWELNTKGMGGPFVNYTFYDEKTNRIYMLDGSVFAPKYYKRNLIQQMDVTLQSFMTAAEISKERKEELVEAAED